MRSPAASVALIACGALSTDLAEIIERCALAVDVYPLPPFLHNQPKGIASAVEEKLGEIQSRYATVAVAYADCGTYGALDEVCARRGLVRLKGQECYGIYAGDDTYQRLLEKEPGTYVLTDFLAASFQRSVIVELGLDRYPELRDDYFGNYRRVVWLTQYPTPLLEDAARRAADSIDLPLEILNVGTIGLEKALIELLQAQQAQQAQPTPAQRGTG